MQIHIDVSRYFWIRHKTGIPFTKLVNLAGEALQEKIETMSREELDVFSQPHRIRTPERQQELDRRRGYLDGGQRKRERRKTSSYFYTTKGE
jgi:hypothetical protein